MQKDMRQQYPFVLGGTESLFGAPADLPPGQSLAKGLDQKHILYYGNSVSMQSEGAQNQ